jgi:hypothetical protein
VETRCGVFRLVRKGVGKMRIIASFRDQRLKPCDYERILSRLVLAANALRVAGLVPGNWSLQTQSSLTAESRRLDLRTARPEIASMLQREFRGLDHCSIGLVAKAGAHGMHTMACHVGSGDVPNMIEINLRGASDRSFEKYVEVMHVLALCYRPGYISVAPPEYEDVKLLDDRPGVGWILFLPRLIRPEQVQAAEAVVPFYEIRGDAISHRPFPRMIGTAVVSTVSAPLDTKCEPQMLRTYDIDRQLVATSLMPRYAGF